ncbi:MAG: FlgD immunoglobulin-like domain containing protein [Armatimonadota bacterium]|nr:FlgD immunoglobulin-like domain containing protein [Armatimonadota bacterium]
MRTTWGFAWLTLLAATAAWSTPYYNVVNAPFNTRSNGPQGALVIDVPAGTRSATELRQLVIERAAPVQRAQVRMLAQQVRRWKQRGALPESVQVSVDTLVVLRQGGQILRPPRTRYGDGTLSFVFEGWDGAQEVFLRRVIGAAVPLIEQVYGKPAQSGTVKVVNYDRDIGDRDAVSGGIYDASRNEILFPVYNSQYSVVINLVHLLVHAFHGPLVFEYDAWEEGFARAVTLIVAHRVAQALGIDDPEGFFKTDPLYHALPYYDLLNQPALGNNTFIAPSLKQLPITPGQLGGMYHPRMQMAGSAWLKVYMEDPEFFKKFNARYYAQYNPNETIKLSGDIPRLKAIAASVLANGGTVEGLPFERWYERQYILDTSVSFGKKLYAWVLPDRAEEGKDNPGLSIVLIHYQTTATGDEIPLNGVCYPVYWDADQQNRLFLGVQYDRIDIVDGEGTVAPLFINIGGAQRVFVDLPVSGLALRIAFAPGYGGTKNNPNNLYGAVSGLNSGTVHIRSSLGVEASTTLAQGGFGLRLPSPAFEQLARYTITIKDSDGNTVAERQVNLGYQEAVLVLEATDSAQTLTHTFPAGLQMISLPIQPFVTDNADALGIPRGQLLLAHWRQDTPGENKYLLYPTAPPFRPGVGYWVKLRSNVVADIRGVTPRPDQNFTIATTFGWNQIGNPFTTPVNVSDIEVQYLLNEPVLFETAVSRGWVGGTVWRYNPATNSYEPATVLQPWEGYWLRVLVAEGVTLTYPAPLNRSRARSRALSSSGAKADWLVTLTAHAGESRAQVRIGQSASASEGFDPVYDSEAPPEFEGMTSLSVLNAGWGALAGRYAVDVRRSGARAQWNLLVRTAAPEREVTLTWSDLRSLPRGVRLVLLDEVTGRRYHLRSVSSVTLRTDQTGTRLLQLVAEPQSEGMLRITGLRAQRTRGGAYSIHYVLSADAQVQAEIVSASGKPVKILQSGAPSRAGVQSVSWDGRDAGGVAVPAGAYLLRLRAYTEDGTSTQAVLPLVVTR